MKSISFALICILTLPILFIPLLFMSFCCDKDFCSFYIEAIHRGIYD